MPTVERGAWGRRVPKGHAGQCQRCGPEAKPFPTFPGPRGRQDDRRGGEVDRDPVQGVAGARQAIGRRRFVTERGAADPGNSPSRSSGKSVTCQTAMAAAKPRINQGQMRASKERKRASSIRTSGLLKGVGNARSREIKGGRNPAWTPVGPTPSAQAATSSSPVGQKKYSLLLSGWRRTSSSSNDRNFWTQI